MASTVSPPLFPGNLSKVRYTYNRTRDCDSAVAQIHKIAYKVLYGGLHYDLVPNTRLTTMTAANLKVALINAAQAWADRFNWPAPGRPDPIDAAYRAGAPGFCVPGGQASTAAPPVTVTQRRNEVKCPLEQDPVPPSRTGLAARRNYMRAQQLVREISSPAAAPGAPPGGGHWGSAAAPMRARWPYTNTTCWLCGTLIKYGRIGVPAGPHTNPHYQCEHIFNPADQNVLHQYITKIPEVMPASASAANVAASNHAWEQWLVQNVDNEAFLLIFYNFGPSHTCCNQWKRQVSLFTIGWGERQAEFNESGLSQVLESIARSAEARGRGQWARNSWNCNDLDGLKTDIRDAGGINQWVAKRINDIKRDIVGPTGPLVASIGRWPMSALAQAARGMLIEGSVVDEATASAARSRSPTRTGAAVARAAQAVAQAQGAPARSLSVLGEVATRLGAASAGPAGAASAASAAPAASAASAAPASKGKGKGPANVKGGGRKRRAQQTTFKRRRIHGSKRRRSHRRRGTRKRRRSRSTRTLSR